MELTSLLLCALVAITTLIVYVIRKRLNYWKIRGIPHEAPHLLSGNFQGLKTKYHLQDIYQRFYTKFKGSGPFCGFYFFQSPAVFVLDLQLVKNVLIKDFGSFTDRPSYYNEKDDPISAHLFALNGNKWKTMRQKLTPTFTSGKMKFMFPTLLKVGYEFAEVFGEMLKDSSTVEVRELFARFTTDVIGSCAFGIECNSLKDPNAEFRIMGRRSFSERQHRNFTMGLAIEYPKLANMLGVKVFPTDPAAFFLKAVRDTVAFREANGVKRNDFMDLLIEMKNSTEAKRLTINEIAAQAYVFFLAGFETSSTTGSFVLYELARHQDVQDKVRKEIKTVMEKHKQEFTYESIKDMTYLDQVISETLRLYTVLPALVRRALVDYTVPGSPKYVIKKGMAVIIPAAAVHRDPAFYPNPNVFDPDRFASDKVQERDSVLWLPFGDGPRNCIGMRFGQMQTRIGLALLLQRFKFSLAKETVVPIKMDNTSSFCSSDGGIFLKVEKV